MKKNFLLLFVLISYISCQNKVMIVSNINGYWEIQEVVSPDGNKKTYKVNEVIDYFEIKNNIGFRKKVTPQLDGTYLTNDEFESIEIKDSVSTYYIKYKTDLTSRKEQIVEASDSILILKDNQNFEYFYKRHIPFSVK